GPCPPGPAPAPSARVGAPPPRRRTAMPTDPSISRTRPLVRRRRFLKWSGAAGIAAAGGAYWSIGPSGRRTRASTPADTPLKHVVISMQENRSFDHYFGYA